MDFYNSFFINHSIGLTDIINIGETDTFKSKGKHQMTKKEKLTNKPMINANVPNLLEELNNYETNDQGMQSNALKPVSLIHTIIAEEAFEIDTTVKTDQEVNVLIIQFADECLNKNFKKDFSSKKKECFKKAFKIVVANAITSFFMKLDNSIIDKNGKVLFINGNAKNNVIKKMNSNPPKPMIDANLKKSMEIANSILKGEGFDTQGSKKTELEKASQSVQNLLENATNKSDGTIKFSRKENNSELQSVIKTTETMVDSVLLEYAISNDDNAKKKIELSELFSTLISSEYFVEIQELAKEKKQSNKK